MSLWVLRYRLEELRELHAARRHYLREAVYCVALAVLTRMPS